MTQTRPPFDDPVTPLLQARIRTLFKHLPKALAGDVEGIHQLRVASRRLRVALPIMSRKPHGRRVRRAVRMVRLLTRTAGRSRDLDVTVGLFEEHLNGRNLATPEALTLRRRLRTARARSRRRMNEDLLDLDIAWLRRDLRTILARHGDALFTVLSRLRRTRDVEGADLLAMLDDLGERFEPALLHRFRSRARSLRYAAEISAEMRDEPSEAPKLLKQVQERLGAMHDTFVLSEWLGRQAGAAGRRGQLGLASTARSLQSEFLGLSHGHHRAFLEEDPRDLLRRAIASMTRSVSAA